MDVYFSGMGSINDILEGWGNLILRPEHNSELVSSRILVCNDCPIRTGVMCDKRKGGCGCVIVAKVRVEESGCPKGKW